jgi:Na+/proline symporter
MRVLGLGFTSLVFHRYLYREGFSRHYVNHRFPVVVASSAIVRDIYQQIFHPQLKLNQMTATSRKVTLLMALIALALALTVAISTPGRTIFWFVIFGWSGIAASICPMIILSLFWKKYTANGAMASMIAGFMSIPIFKFLIPAIDSIGPYFEQIAELAPSFLLGLLAGYWVSKWKPDKEIELHFQQLLK